MYINMLNWLCRLLSVCEEWRNLCGVFAANCPSSLLCRIVSIPQLSPAAFPPFLHLQYPLSSHPLYQPLSLLQLWTFPPTRKKSALMLDFISTTKSIAIYFYSQQTPVSTQFYTLGWCIYKPRSIRLQMSIWNALSPIQRWQITASASELIHLEPSVLLIAPLQFATSDSAKWMNATIVQYSD